MEFNLQYTNVQIIIDWFVCLFVTRSVMGSCPPEAWPRRRWVRRAACSVRSTTGRRRRRCTRRRWAPRPAARRRRTGRPACPAATRTQEHLLSTDLAVISALLHTRITPTTRECCWVPMHQKTFHCDSPPLLQHAPHGHFVARFWKATALDLVDTEFWLAVIGWNENLTSRGETCKFYVPCKLCTFEKIQYRIHYNVLISDIGSAHTILNFLLDFGCSFLFTR